MDTNTVQEMQRANYAIAEAIAPTWARRRQEIESAADAVRTWMVQELAPSAGDTILELAAGTGDTGFEVASVLGGRGKLISTDFSPGMLGSARRRGTELGCTNVEYRLIDAQAIDLTDNSVDGVLCRFGLMLMVDPAAAAAETRRVLRPGGRLVVAVWGAPPQNPFFTAVVGALIAGHHLAPPDPEGPGVFRLADPAKLTALLTEAGYERVRAEAVAVHYRIANVDAYLDLVADTAGPIGLTVQGLGDADRSAVAAQVAGVLEPFAAPDGFDIPGVAGCAVAR